MDNIVALLRIVQEHPDVPSFRRALEDYERLHPENERISELQQTPSIDYKSYDTIEEARANADEKCIIVYARGRYMVFKSLEKLEIYYCDVKENITKVTHEQIIDVQSSQKLVFIYEDANEERISELKQQLASFFKSDKVVFIPKSRIANSQDMYCVISDAVGTYEENKKKFDEFMEYLRKNAKYLVGYCRYIESKDGYIRMPLDYMSEHRDFGYDIYRPINIIFDNSVNADTINNLNTGPGQIVVNGNVDLRKWIESNPPVDGERVTEYRKRFTDEKGSINRKVFDGAMQEQGYKKVHKRKGDMWQKG